MYLKPIYYKIITNSSTQSTKVSKEIAIQQKWLKETSKSRKW